MCIIAEINFVYIIRNVNMGMGHTVEFPNVAMAAEDGRPLPPVLIQVMLGAGDPMAEQLRVASAGWTSDRLEGCWINVARSTIQK